jgi:hypothetical protein
MIKVRRIQAGETELLKQIRLASLRDAPYAFGTTYESALKRSAETWREKTENTAHGPTGQRSSPFRLMCRLEWRHYFVSKDKPR